MVEKRYKWINGERREIKKAFVGVNGVAVEIWNNEVGVVNQQYMSDLNKHTEVKYE